MARSKIVLFKSIKFGLGLLLAATSLSACSFVQKHTSPETYNMLTFNDGGVADANKAVVAYTKGDFDTADEYVLSSLHDNKKNAQALLVGALLSEKTNRPNRARQYYEEILLYNGDEMSVLGSTTPEPQKITDIAKKRLRQLNLSQNKLIVEDNSGNKVFNIDNAASVKNSTTAMEEALFLRQQKLGRQNAASAEADRNAVEVLFDDNEKNTVSRFMILKELAENDLITKEEFLRARQANIGGLLPLTHAPASSQVIKPVPSASIVIDRINALKSAVEDRAITPKEFSAERNLIIEAVLPPYPAQRLKKKAPAKDIISAAKDLRKLEVVYDLNLITSSEKAREQQAIEQSLGLKSQPVTKPATAPKAIPAPVRKTAPEVKVQEQIRISDGNNVSSVTETTSAPVTIQANRPTSASSPLLPDVTSPFEN